MFDQSCRKPMHAEPMTRRTSRRALAGWQRAGLCMMLFCWGCATTLAPPGAVSVSSYLRQQPAPAQADTTALLRAQQLFIRGMTHTLLDDPERAVALFKKALELVPEQPAILSALADAYDQLGEPQTALFYLKRAHQLDPGTRAYAFQLAGLQARTGALETALATYEALLAQHPNDFDARFALAHMQTNLSRFDDALDTYRALLRHHGENLHVRYQMLQLYNQVGEGEGLLETLKAMTVLDAGNLDLRRMLGQTYARLDQPEAASAVLRGLLIEDPGDLEAALLLADLYRTLGQQAPADSLIQQSLRASGAEPATRLAQATALYRQNPQDTSLRETVILLAEAVLHETPDAADALFILGELRYQSGAYAEAGALLSRALAQHPERLDAWTQAAAAYLQAGQPDQTLTLTDEGLLLFPGQYPLLRLAAYAAAEMSRNQDAAAYARDALAVLREEQPDAHEPQADLLALMGLLHARAQRTAAADSAYAAALDLHAGQPLALNNYAYSLAQRSETLDQAREMAQRAVAQAPENAAFLDTLGWIYFKLEQYDEAEKWVRKALDTGVASAAVYEHYGDIQQRLGHPDEALRHWQQALDLNPDSSTLPAKIQGRHP